MKKKRLLAILASPRENGNVASMIKIACRSAMSAGWEVKMVNLYEKNIAYCKGCMACKKTGRCVIKDDIQPIIDDFTSSDIIVLGSPTYFANVTAPLKNMFDRMVATVMDDNTNRYPKPKLSKNQKYILLTACNTPFPFDRIAKQSTGCIGAMKEFMNISGMTYGGSIIFAGTRNKEGVPKNLEEKIKKLTESALHI